MRDLLNLLDNVLTEENLGAKEFPLRKMSTFIDPKTKKQLNRAELFLYKVKNRLPFTRLDNSKPQKPIGEVIIDPREAQAVAAWIASGPTGVIELSTLDGDTVRNTQLLKTVEFGSKEAENIKIKPSDVLPTDEKTEIADLGNNIDLLLLAGGFPASEMYDKIANSPALVNMGPLGDAVIYMAQQANDGQIPMFPSNLNKDEIKAIELYASEYLGALGLVSGGVPFIRGSREEFEEFVGGNLADMIMFFPKASNNPLADSFSVINDATGHAVKISSKAAGKGAPPALGSMKLPQEVREKYPDAAEFLDIAQDPALSQFTQPFAMMNYLYLLNPNKVPRAYRGMVPFDPEFVSRLEASMKTGKALPRSIMKNFEQQLSDKVLNGTAADGGKAWYAVTADVMRAVNTDRSVPDLRAALIESLGYNFIQLYSNVKGNKLVTEAFWPAKISGQVKLKSKGSAGELKGKMSVEISPGGGDIEPGEIPGVEMDSDGDVADVDAETLDDIMDAPRLKGPGAKAARGSAAPKTDEKTLGRTKRNS
jgi:hypothetical protein